MTSTNSDKLRQGNEALLVAAQGFNRAAKAGSTRRAYQTDWRDFTDWTAWRGFEALPAEPTTVALYLTALAEAGKRPSTLQRRRAAIAYMHTQAGLDSPTHSAIVNEVMAGITREIGSAKRRKAPAVTDDLRAMLTALPGDLRGVRDRAVLLIGFAGAFRRSELVALDVEDIEEAPEGLCITIRRSKTDQQGAGRLVGVPRGTRAETCPVRAYRDWLHATGITTGPLFRGISKHGALLDRLSDKGVARIVKHAAEAAGLDPARYSGHSLRAGLATSAAAAGALDREIMQQTGHKRVDTLYQYIRHGSLFKHNAAAKTGL